MNSAEMVVRLRFQGRYASETQQECTERKNNERIEAADRIAALEAWKAEAMEVLRPFVRIAEAEDFAGTKDGESIFVNVNLCRAARRLVEKGDGRAS